MPQQTCHSVRGWSKGGYRSGIQDHVHHENPTLINGLFVYFAFCAANLYIFVVDSTRAVDHLRVASALLTSPYILYLQVATFVDGAQLI